MSNIDKTSKNQDTIKIPLKPAANPKSQNKELIWDSVPKVLQDYFPDFNKKPLSEEAQKIKDDWSKVVPDFSDEFAELIVESAESIKCKPEDLAALLFKESRFNPQAGKGSYKGIGQMSARSLDHAIKYAIDSGNVNVNTTINIKKFHKLSREEQLPYVQNYVLAMKDSVGIADKQLGSGDLYGLFLAPFNLKKPALTTTTNMDLDYNKDGKVTKEDLKKILENVKKIPDGFPDKQNIFIYRPDNQE